MNWAEVAKKNAGDQVKNKKVYEKEKRKKPVDLYPEDLFDMIYLEQIRKLNTEINEEIYATGAEILNYNYSLHDLYECNEFILSTVIVAQSYRISLALAL